MFGVEFYPTPKSVVDEMIEFSGVDVQKATILEPSAGKGDIAKAVAERTTGGSKWSYKRGKDNLFCIELDPRLQAVLRADGFKVVANDFLQWTPSRYFDLILMNPPFSNGEKHLLHAWDIMTSGVIVCLLNAETINNPFSKERVLLSNLIAKHGTTKELGFVFKDAERSADVNVAMVRLEKKGKDNFKDMFDQAGLSSMSFEEGEEPQDIFLPASRNVIETMALQYKDIQNKFKAAKVAVRALNKAVEPLNEYVPRDNFDREYVWKSLQDENWHKGCNYFAQESSRGAWATIMKMAGLSQLMTDGVQKEFEKFSEESGGLDFTEDNILRVIDTLRASLDTIMDAALVEVFEELTKYHEENRVYVEGWKTNDAYAVGKKFILPNVCRFEWNRFDMSYYRTSEVDDIDRVMCSLEGRKIEDVFTIKQALQEDWKDPTGQAESEFFNLRYYKKGTVHFLFKDKTLWERFNIAAAKNKKWLPHDFKYKQGCLGA